jgi:hypothetical protein
MNKAYPIIKQIPLHILYEFLEKVCLKYAHCYDFDYNAYRKMTFQQCHLAFIEQLKPYYRVDITQTPVSFQSIVNMIRQICRFQKVKFLPIKTYHNSRYFVHYHIYYD